MVPNTLSCAAISAISVGINFFALAAAKLPDLVDMATCQTAIMNFNLRTFLLDPTTQLHYVVSLGLTHSLVPVSFHCCTFDNLHSLSHLGVRATRKLIARKCIWHGLGQQVGVWTKSCVTCQQAKVSLHHHALLSI